MKLRIKAFTTVEMVLVIAIMAIVATTGYVTVVSLYHTTVVDAELHTVVSNIQRTRQKSIGNPTGTEYSIKFLSDKYVVFPGTTYSANDPSNNSYRLENTVIVSTTFPSGLISFANFTGRVTTPGHIDLSSGSITKRITINSLGIVEDIQ